MRRGPDYGAPARLLNLLALFDPDAGGTEVRIGSDLLALRGYSRQELASLAASLRNLLDDASVCDADLKGLLNRAMGKAWGASYELRPRDFLEAAHRKLQAFEHA